MKMLLSKFFSLANTMLLLSYTSELGKADISFFGSRFPRLSKHMALFQREVFKEFCLQGSAKPGILINIHIYLVAK